MEQDKHIIIYHMPRFSPQWNYKKTFNNNWSTDLEKKKKKGLNEFFFLDTEKKLSNLKTTVSSKDEALNHTAETFREQYMVNAY